MQTMGSCQLAGGRKEVFLQNQEAEWWSSLKPNLLAHEHYLYFIGWPRYLNLRPFLIRTYFVNTHQQQHENNKAWGNRSVGVSAAGSRDGNRAGFQDESKFDLHFFSVVFPFFICLCCLFTSEPRTQQWHKGALAVCSHIVPIKWNHMSGFSLLNAAPH